MGLLFFFPVTLVQTSESVSSPFTPVSTSSDRPATNDRPALNDRPAVSDWAEPTDSDRRGDDPAESEIQKDHSLRIEPNGNFASLPLVPAAKGVKDETEMARLVEGGKNLLVEQNWTEAKAHYERALKKYPDNQDFHQAYFISRAHLEIENRYHDASFCHFLAQTNKEEILALCDDVLKNIQAWHVDAPDWKSLFRMGMESFRIALTEEAFLRQNRVPLHYDAKLPKYGDDLLNYSRNWSIRDRRELKADILKIAESVQKNTQISGISVIMEILCGMVNSLDSYSAYLTSGQINDVYSMIDGHFVGLGVYIESKWRNGALLISKVIPKSPAEEAGLTDGDRILEIDRQSVTELGEPEEAGALLQGPEGSKVVLRVQSKNEAPRDVVVLRRSFDIPSVEDVKFITTPDDRRKTGFFRINAFQKTTVHEVKTELVRLQRDGMECLIIDLRNNPGGLLDKAIELSNLFLDGGTIVRTKGRMSERVETADAVGTCQIPLILLIDENSASAAEIFAGAIQENGRGLVVGSRSFGKGTVQVIIQLESVRSDELIAGLRLTTEKFYSPRGRSYSGVGVIPNIDISGEYAAARPAAAKAVSLEEAQNAPQTENIVPNADVCLARALSEADRVLRAPSRPSEQFTQNKRKNLQ